MLLQSWLVIWLVCILIFILLNEQKRSKGKTNNLSPFVSFVLLQTEIHKFVLILNICLKKHAKYFTGIETHVWKFYCITNKYKEFGSKNIVMSLFCVIFSYRNSCSVFCTSREILSLWTTLWCFWSLSFMFWVWEQELLWK